MKEKITPFLKQRLHDPAIAQQYIAHPVDFIRSDYNDPLMEDTHEMVKGLIHKYPNRALIKVSYQCAAHCRFCTRIRQIGQPSGTLSEMEIENVLDYLYHHPEIDDVILSGGDPLYTPKITSALLKKLSQLETVKVIRIGTRLPLQSPSSFDTGTMTDLLALIDETGKQKPLHMLLHVEHPSELNSETEAVISKLRMLKITLFSQTVFLKNINDDVDILERLFKRLYHLGVLPYYLYHCDAVQGLEHFRGNIEEEKLIATELRKRLSGLACPLFVEDIEDGYGKIPV